jgi:prepilin-type N-terminal cleavage/methylation domain-containing protein
MPRRANGFSLIEAVVVIAIMAILAGAALPLMIKSVNQQAEQTTRANAQVAYNAIFGARDHRVSNMIADFGYTLPASGSTLGDLMVRPAATIAWGAGPGFSWGWNGPYWMGSTRTVAGVTLPVDGWGHPFTLRFTAGVNGGWQVVSGGEDGNPATAADNIVYPPTPAPLVQCVLTLTVHNARSPAPNPISGTITITDRNGVKIPHPQTGAPYYVFNNLASGGTFNIGITGVTPGIVTVNPGPVNISINITTGVPFTISEVVDLLPGQNYSHTYDVY